MMATDQTTDMRQQIVDAAERVMTDLGIKAATTRAIAECAGCAEGSIYRYFADKQALFMEVVKSRYPEFIVLTERLPERAGTGTVRRNLEAVSLAAVRFYRGVLPLVAAAFSERKLLEEQRRYFMETEQGPLRGHGLVATYIRREQRLGRVSERISAEHATRLLLGGCYAQASLLELMGDEASLGTDERFAADLIRNLMEGLGPRREPPDRPGIRATVRRATGATFSRQATGGRLRGAAAASAPPHPPAG
jgi:AcrR family transcriptional regulator